MSHDPKRIQDSIAHFTTLGLFIDNFAQVETLLYSQLLKEAAIPFETAQAIFSDAKNDRARDLIGRIRSARGLSESTLLKRAFDQLSLINRLRNDLVHYGTRIQDGERWVSNRLWAHVPSKVREYRVTPDLLIQASNDLEVIKMNFMRNMIEPGSPAEAAMGEGLDAASQAPWQYKPAPQGNAGAKR